MTGITIRRRQGGRAFRRPGDGLHAESGQDPVAGGDEKLVALAPPMVIAVIFSSTRRDEPESRPVGSKTWMPIGVHSVEEVSGSNRHG